MSLDKLFSLDRNGIEELSLTGQIVVCDDRSVLFSSSEVIGRYPTRSLLKPFQFLATGMVPGTPFTEPSFEVAALGSVSATESQVVQIKRWYQGKEWESLFNFLQLPPCYPQEELYRVKLKNEGHPPDWWYHHCLSKHLAILRACARNGWEKETYNSVGHPYHSQLLENLSQLLKLESLSVPFVRDGCSLPSPVLSLSQMAILYQRLAAADEGSLGRLRDAMMRFPQWIGGPKRIDSQLMELNSGKLVAKEGADGLLAIGVVPSERFPKGLGLIVKIASGYLPNFAALAFGPLLENLGLNRVGEVPRGQTVRYHYRPFVSPKVNAIDISPLVSSEIAVFPGDVPFHRKVSLEMEKGAPYTLSSLHATFHLGAHADAPNHYHQGGGGIESVSLTKYFGPCQVVEVRKGKDASVEVEDLRGCDLRAPRILFKTRSFPDSNKFNEDFVSLSAELVHWLGGRGVQLIGIDTPSIDPARSKELMAHHACFEHGIAILEGLVLSDATPKLYDLVALPLKILGADASPVRAVLLPREDG